jgi:hypothetical protein
MYTMSLDVLLLLRLPFLLSLLLQQQQLHAAQLRLCHQPFTCHVCAVPHQVLCPVEGAASRSKAVLKLTAINRVTTQVGVTRIQACRGGSSSSSSTLL